MCLCMSITPKAIQICSTSWKRSVDHAFTETPPQEIPSLQTEPAAEAPRQDSTQAPAPNTRNLRNGSSVASRITDVKRRLIELWHQSLARSETRSWTAFSNLNRGVSKKAAYTAETNR